MSGTSHYFPRPSRPVIGIIVIAVLILVLSIPIRLIQGLIEERLETRELALAEVTALWGGAQSIIGPRLVVPYRRVTDAGVQEDFVSFLPASTRISGNLETQALSRGLFTIPVYEGQLSIRGRFDALDQTPEGVEVTDLLWERGSVVFEMTDPRAIGGGSTLSWKGQAVELRPGTRGSAGRSGIHATVPQPDDGAAEFEATLRFKGSQAIWFVPFARDTRVDLVSDWPHPSFSGAWAPTDRELGPSGFAASWQVTFLGRDYAQTWRADVEPQQRIIESRFGANLIAPVDHYRMSERSTKYAPLFLAMTFGLLWLFDTLIGIRVHPIQYLLLGAAVCLFYLLELSLSEHIGFFGAYTTAASGVVGLSVIYTMAVLKSTTRGMTVGGSMGALYAYLLVLLSLERYALLAGSLGLFAALAVVMYSTRWVNWECVVRAERPTG